MINYLQNITKKIVLMIMDVEIMFLAFFLMNQK
jgi:hypothetical protein